MSSVLVVIPNTVPNFSKRLVNRISRCVNTDMFLSCRRFEVRGIECLTRTRNVFMNVDFNHVSARFLEFLSDFLVRIDCSDDDIEVLVSNIGHKSLKNSCLFLSPFPRKMLLRVVCFKNTTEFVTIQVKGITNLVRFQFLGKSGLTALRLAYEPINHRG